MTLKQQSPSLELANAVRNQTQAQDTARSVWVAASAGAGKTRVLTTRILRLLLEGAAPANILALTYTRAAAKEMTERVIKMAQGLALANDEQRTEQICGILGLADPHMIQPEVWDRARCLYELILDAPGGLAIQTIHSFCQSLLGRFPFEAGLTPGFEAIEDATRNEILGKACADTLANHPSAFGQLKAGVRSDALIPLANALVKIDWQGVPDTARLAAFDTALGGGFAQGSLQQIHGAFADEIAKRTHDLAALAARADQTGKAWDAKLANCIRTAVDAREPLFIFASHFLTDGRLKASQVHTKALDKDPTLQWLSAIIPTRWARLQSQRLYDLNVDLMAFGVGVSAAFAKEKARRAALDFDDLITAAGRLLSQDGGPTYVQYRLDQRLEHILVDEAQDTSAEQWQLIAGLAEPFFDDASEREDRQRTLFVVGDFKQSIYSFQGAKPQLFGAWRQHFQDLAGSGLKSVSMTHSFRSAPEILAFVDQVSQSLGNGGLQFADQPLPSHRAVKSSRPGLVQVWPVPQEEADAAVPDWQPMKELVGQDSQRVNLGRVIAQHIHRLCYDSAWASKPDAYLAQGRRVQPGDFLILVQNRRPDFANALIGELKALHVPVTGVDRLRLIQELVVQDLLAVGEICLQPGDDLSLAALLKSPLYGYGEQALFDLAYGRGGQSLMGCLQAQNPELATEFTELKALIGRMGIYDFFATYLYVRGGRGRILRHIGPEADEILSVFLDRARLHDLQHNGDMARFIESERQSAQDLKRDASESAGQVRLMTVHGAKGLEAPIVILPDLKRLGRQGGNRPEDQLVEMPDVGPVWVPSSQFDRPQTRAAKDTRIGEAEAERERLFYVALTRAEERLVICTDRAQEDRPEKGQWSWYNRAFDAAALMGGPCDFDLLDIGWPLSKGVAFGTAPTVPQAAEHQERAQNQEALPPWACVPVPRVALEAPLTPSALVGTAGQEATISPTSRAHALQRGTLIHAALEHLPQGNPKSWPNRLEHFFANRVPDVAATLRDQWCQEVKDALANPSLRLFFGPNSQAEVALVGQVEGRKAVGQIDRLHVDQAGKIVRILDYKTNRPPPTNPAEVSPAYIRQMRAYRDLVQPLYPDYEIQAYLFWTHTGYLMDVTSL